MVGARFDDRATGKLDAFAPNARVVHLDVRSGEIGKLRHAEVGVAGDLAESLATLTPPARRNRAAAMPRRARPGARCAASDAASTPRATTRPATASTRRPC